MDSVAHLLVAQAYNNAWANHRLLRACMQLEHAQFVAKGTSFFPSIKATLNHIVTVDWFYVAAIERGLAGLPVDPDGRKCFDPEEPFDDVRALADAQRDVDRRLIALCEALEPAALAQKITIPWRTIGDETTVRVLMHLFQHQIHHRGQAHAMLAGTTVAPPQLDEFYCAGDAPLRDGDLAELGWTEAMLWAR